MFVMVVVANVAFRYGKGVPRWLRYRRGVVGTARSLVILAAILSLGVWSGVVVGGVVALVGFPRPKLKWSSFTLYASRAAIGAGAGFVMQQVALVDGFVDDLVLFFKAGGVGIAVFAVLGIVFAGYRRSLGFGRASAPVFTTVERDPKRRFTTEERDFVRRYQEGRCFYCQAEFRPTETGHADHVFPHSKGGPTVISNCVVACPADNSTKGDLSLEYGSPDLDLFGTKFYKKHRKAVRLPTSTYLEQQQAAWNRYQRSGRR